MAYHDKSRVTASMVERYVDFSRAVGHRDILGIVMTQTVNGDDPRANANTEALSAIKVPTLILWGREDEMIDPADAMRFQSAIFGAKLITYPNVGHVPMEEAAERSAVDLQSWIETIRR